MPVKFIKKFPPVRAFLLPILLVSSASSAQNSTGEEAGEIWRGLERGMSAEQVSQILLSMPNVTKVKIGNKKGIQTVEVSTDKSGMGFRVAEYPVAIFPKFYSRGLSALSLRVMPKSAFGYNMCGNEIVYSIQYFRQLLSEKYEIVESSGNRTEFADEKVSISLFPNIGTANEFMDRICASSGRVHGNPIIEYRLRADVESEKSAKESRENSRTEKAKREL